VESADVVIVGGGIAGGALATVLATAGVRVLTLERLLLGTGANVVPRLDLYDEGSAEPLAIEVGEVLGGIEGSLNIAHPNACSGLAAAA
jgi:thioredoxin reductase